MNREFQHSPPQNSDTGKSEFTPPELTKYGTIKDVYKGPSCKAVMANNEDK